MTRIKFCGLSRTVDIEAVNKLNPEYIGFVFAQKSKRFVDYDKAKKLKSLLNTGIKAVGVFVNENPENIAKLLNEQIIDIVQLHGDESEEFIKRLRGLTETTIIKAFHINDLQDIEKANASSADFVLLDSENGGSGKEFDWSLVQKIRRPYFLAGGLTALNVACAIRNLHPYAVDVSSGIETNGVKDATKAAEFAAAVRKENNYDK